MAKKTLKRPPATFTDTHGSEYVSSSELARRIGVTPAAITYARKRKWVVTVRKNGADVYEWPAARDGYLAHAPMIAGPKPAPSPAPEDSPESVKKSEPSEDPGPVWSGRGRPPGQVGELQSASASKAAYGAALLQLEYEQRLGNLVPRDVVDAVWKNAGESLKKSLMSIPDRVAPQFGGKDSHKLYRTLVEEMTLALASLTIEYNFPEVKNQGRPRGRS